MLKHIVMWKLKDEAEGKDKKANGQKIIKMLSDLKQSIPELRHIEAGQNIRRLENGFDLVLYSEFQNEDDLNEYRVHPEHQKVVEFIGKVTSERAFVDYYT